MKSSEHPTVGETNAPLLRPPTDDLTSLQWLTGVKVDDIFDGRPIQHSRLSGLLLRGDGDERRGDVRQVSENPLDYRQKGDMKPPYSYAVLIIMAMKSKGTGQMTLSEIYKWIADNFIFYRNAETAWQVSKCRSSEFIAIFKIISKDS